jgi:hypothetical protein
VTSVGRAVRYGSGAKCLTAQRMERLCGMPGAEVSIRSMMVRNKLMRTAERLYAEQGLASVSIRKIDTASGQRKTNRP